MAILYPDRATQGDVVRRLNEAGITLDRAADHGVSQPVYLTDRGGNGVKLHGDKPKADRPRDADDGLKMINRPLGVAALVADGAARSRLYRHRQTCHGRRMLAVMEIPVWLVILGGGLAAVAVLDRILVPSVRWYLRRRFLHAIERLNARLQLKIQPFKLMRRRDTIDRLTHDPQVMEAVVKFSEEADVPLYVAMRRAEHYAREIVPSFSASTYFGFATRAAAWLSNLVYDVRLGVHDDAALAAIDPKATVIFVMNHRSNMDYVVVTHLVAERSALSYAVGEWARIWPLQGLIRAMGAYFIRRKSSHGLYRRVLARYVQMATEGGVTQAVFPEGGLTLDGRLRPPKLGLLSYVVSDFKPGASRDVVFLPVALNYDRVLEDRVLTKSAAKATRRFEFRMGVFLRFMLRQTRLRLTHRFHRARACVGFGQPLSLSDFLGGRAPEGDTVIELGQELMDRVGRVMPVMPVPLVAAILTQSGAPMSRAAVTAAAHEMLIGMRARGAQVQIREGEEETDVASGLHFLTLRNLVLREGELYSANAKEIAILQYYANSISHLLTPDRAFSDAISGADTTIGPT